MIALIPVNAGFGHFPGIIFSYIIPCFRNHNSNAIKGAASEPYGFVPHGVYRKRRLTLRKLECSRERSAAEIIDKIARKSPPFLSGTRTENEE